jgi:hypothetical protein
MLVVFIIFLNLFLFFLCSLYFFSECVTYRLNFKMYFIMDSLTQHIFVANEKKRLHVSAACSHHQAFFVQSLKRSIY